MLARGWLEEAGLEVEVDEAGNMFGRSGAAPGLWTGSHLDTVPQGGKFDGALGVVAAIEAVERAGRGTVAVFRDEERGCAGSRAVVARSGLPEAFLEVHVEQGPRLADAGAPLGMVTGVVGVRAREFVVEGRAGHAGTTPMDVRDDALTKAAELILRIPRDGEGDRRRGGDRRAVEAEPGAVNVIPARVTLSVDARAPDADRSRCWSRRCGLDADATAPRRRRWTSGFGTLLREELEARGLPVVELASGAGHDAAVLAAAGAPSAMLFVRSLNGGVQHSPDELSSEDDVALAVDVLAAALARA